MRKNQYVEIMEKVIEMIMRGACPREAWQTAIKGYSTKGCPKCAFLGLCGEGFVQGIPKGSYTSSKKNKRYAIDAVKLLKKYPFLSEKPKLLWEKVTKNKKISHSNQMDVVITLWNRGLILKA